MPVTLSVVGYSGSGKTTFIEKLVAELKSRGHLVGVIKHAFHGFDMDHDGKDSSRHRKAGADSVMVASGDSFALFKNTGTDRLNTLESYFSDMDIILTEGFKRENRPKIEILRREISSTLICGKKENLVAVATDHSFRPESDTDYQLLPLDNAGPAADFIESLLISS